jgi:predicted metal-dependent peptidase
MDEKTLKERKEKAAGLLAQDRQRLLMRMPFVGGLLMRLDLVPVSDRRLDTAATDGDRIFVDLDFYASLDGDERLFVLAHEAWHCALVHFARRQGRDPLLFNAAADLEIHFVLTDEGLKAPFVLPHDPSWKGLSAEEIYERLVKAAKNAAAGKGTKPRDEGKESEHIKGGAGGSFDRHLDSGARAGIENEGAACGGNEGRADGANEGAAGGGNEGRAASGANEGTGKAGGKPAKGFDPDYSPYVKAGAEERCRGRVVSAVQIYQRMKGDLPAGIEKRVAVVLKPELNWRELLAQFVTSCYGGSRRWLPPARRHVWKGLYLQSQRSERLRAVVAIDTSGSTQGDLAKFFTELTSLLGTFGSYELTVIQCDAEVGKVETFDDSNPLAPDHEWETTGGGGTDFRPVFDYVENHPELDPNLLVFFTDGYGNCPDRPPHYPVMWLLTRDGKEQPWGWNVKFSASHGG